MPGGFTEDAGAGGFQYASAGGGGGVPFDVGIAVPNGDQRAIMFVDGTGAVATFGDENGLGTTGVLAGRFKIAEHVNDNVFIGHIDANTSSTNYQLFMAPNGTLKIKAPGAATAMTIIAGDSGASAGSLTVNGEATVRFRWGNTGLSFFGAAEAAKQSIAGSRGGNAALADLLTKLATIGLITDGTTA